MFFNHKQLHAFFNSKSPEDRRFYRSHYAHYLYGPGQSIYQLTHAAQRAEFTEDESKKILKGCLEDILSRGKGHYYIGQRGLQKWFRPWNIVPEIRDFRPTQNGDFGIGIEVEHDFQSAQDAEVVARKIQNWRNITMDCEGGPYGIEVTFPPTLYSKFNANSQAMRYMKLLAGPMAQHCRRHSPSDMVGTHVNVSVPRGVTIDHGRRSQVNNHISRSYMSEDQHIGRPLCERYFNRMPYGSINSAVHGMEMKLFNSVESPQILRKYVEVGIELARLIVYSTEEVNRRSCVEAMERGYARACRLNKEVYVPLTQREYGTFNPKTGHFVQKAVSVSRQEALYGLAALSC